MAALTEEEKYAVRDFCARRFSANWTKEQIRLAAQAVVDLLEGTVLIQRTEVAVSGSTLAAIVSARMDTATSPFVFPVAVKKAIVAEVMRQKFERDK